MHLPKIMKIGWQYIHSCCNNNKNLSCRR